MVCCSYVVGTLSCFLGSLARCEERSGSACSVDDVEAIGDVDAIMDACEAHSGIVGIQGADCKGFFGDSRCAFETMVHSKA